MSRFSLKMNTSFDTFVPRRGTFSYKWDSPDSGRPDYPLWVADMDFQTAPCILDALRERVEHAVFGYVTIPNEYREAVRSWFARRHQWEIPTERIIAAPAIVPALTAILHHWALSGRDRVLLQTPAYNMFFSAIRNAGCTLYETQLVSTNHHYEIDWEDMEAKLRMVDIFLLCNPHNPTGRVWTENELRRITQLCNTYKVLLISDEIHGEFCFSGYHFMPVATVSNDSNYLILTSAGKAFNIAGLPMATLVAGNEFVQHKVEQALEHSCLEDVGIMGLVATIAAYNQGEEWLNELVCYIEENYHTLQNFLSLKAPSLCVTRMEGTYLAWVDIRSLSGTDTERWCHDIQQKTGVKFNPGEMYGQSGYIRVNLACPRSFLTEALTRAFC